MLTRVICVLLTLLFPPPRVTGLSCAEGELFCAKDAQEMAVEIYDALYNLLNGTTQIEAIQAAFNASDLIQYEDIDGSTLLADAANKLKKILKSKTEAVDSIAEFVRAKSPLRQGSGKHRDPPTCSYLKAKDGTMDKKIDLTFHKEFNAKVNLTETVVHFPVDVYEFSKEIKSAIHLTDGLDKVFIENYDRDQFIFAQYFGSTSGLLRYYPAYYWEDVNNKTDLYDCRFRSWYIEAAGQPRDVVLLMDTSGSMYGWALTVAKYTAKRLLRIISDKDHVAFYTFNETAYSISCHTNLERARLKYVNYLSDEIEKIEAYGTSNFTIALNRAFDVLEDSARLNKSCKCQRAIIIFSDYVRSDYAEVLRKRNPDGRVRVFILAFGAPNQGDTSKLEDIACSNNGYFSKVYNYGDVVPAISNILAVFGQPLSLNVPKLQATWSTVYYEYDRQNFVLTVGKSVVLDYSQSVGNGIEPFLGVAAIDVDIPQMKTIMTEMFSGIMYAFMINNNGVIILHPRMVPIDGYTDKPDMDINDMEVTENSEHIIEIAKMMLNRTMGRFRTRSLVYFPNTIRGKETFQDTEYHMTSLDGYPFSIGIVVPGSERQTIKVAQDRINKTLIKESIESDVPDRLRWKKYPLCTRNITDTIEIVVGKLEVAKLEADPCYPDRYYTMAAEIQLTDPLSKWWKSATFTRWKSELLNNLGECIMDAYLVTNAGITRSYMNMSKNNSVMDPMDMQPFIHSRMGIPPNTLLISLLDKRDDDDDVHFNLSYSVGVKVGNDTFEPLAVGIKVRLKYLIFLIRKALGVKGINKSDVSVTLLDENAFIIYSYNDDNYERKRINRFFDYHSLVTDVVNMSKLYHEYQVKDCQQLCREETDSDDPGSSALFLSPLRVINKFISSIWKLFVFYITNLYLDKATATHKTAKQVMCCEDGTTYFRNFSNVEPYEATIPCGSVEAKTNCTKRITMVPILKTNAIMIIDNNKDCMCESTFTKKASYFAELCKTNVSQWQSDLSQQICFDKEPRDKLDPNSTELENTSWNCSADRVSYRPPSPPP